MKRNFSKGLCFMKMVVLLLLMLSLVGCATSYQPSYIISDVEEDSYVIED